MPDEIVIDTSPIELVVEESPIEVVINTSIAVASGGGATTFVALTDTPGSIPDGQYLVGAAGGGSVEFVSSIPAGDVSGLATVATTGAYSDLSGLPSIPSPGGSDDQVQFNNGGAFGGIDDLTWDGTNLTMLASAGTVFTAGSTGITSPVLALSGDTDTGLMLSTAGGTNVGFVTNGDTAYQINDPGSLIRHFFSGFTLDGSNITNNYLFRQNLGAGAGFEVVAGVRFDLFHSEDVPVTLTAIAGDPQLSFNADALGGSVRLVGPDIAANISFTLPSADGGSGEFLRTNGSGALSFAAASFAGLSDTPGALGTTLQIVRMNAGATALEFAEIGPALPHRAAWFPFDYGDDVVALGSVVEGQLHYAATLRSFRLIADAVDTSLTVVLETTTYASYPSGWTTIATLALSSVQKNESTGLSVAIAANSLIRARVSAVASAATRCSAIAEIEPS